MHCKIHVESVERMMERNWPKGIKKTKQRVDIYTILANASKPLTASEIYDQLIEKCKDEKTTYAFSTVYRCLLTFENSGIVNKLVALTDQDAMYELRLEKHHHYAICLKCRERFPLRTCFLGDLKKMLPADMDDFEIVGHQLEIYGYCNKCCNNCEKKELI